MHKQVHARVHMQKPSPPRCRLHQRVSHCRLELQACAHAQLQGLAALRLAPRAYGKGQGRHRQTTSEQAGDRQQACLRQAALTGISRAEATPTNGDGSGGTNRHVEGGGDTDKQSEGRGDADRNPQPEPRSSLQEPAATDTVGDTNGHVDGRRRRRAGIGAGTAAGTCTAPCPLPPPPPSCTIIHHASCTPIARTLHE